MEVTEERFRALARWSPWRWRTLRFTLVRRPWHTPRFEAGLRAWVRRPDAVRVQDLDGNLVQVVHEEPRTLGLFTPTGTSTLALRDPRATRPRWTPTARGQGRSCGTCAWSTIMRLAWEAVLEPTSAYAPRCSCCALLFSEASDLRIVEEDGPSARSRDSGLRYPDTHLVRLDVETGVCVYAEQQGGTRDGQHHHVKIEAVDEPDARRPLPGRFLGELAAEGEGATDQATVALGHLLGDVRAGRLAR